MLLYCSLNLCIIILRVRHVHNKIAPYGIIKVFLTELTIVPMFTISTQESNLEFEIRNTRTTTKT